MGFERGPTHRPPPRNVNVNVFSLLFYLIVIHALKAKPIENGNLILNECLIYFYIKPDVYIHTILEKKNQNLTARNENEIIELAS